MNHIHMNKPLSAKHTALKNTVSFGSCRCGMHQKSEMEYRRAKLQETAVKDDEIIEEDAEIMIDAETPAEAAIPEEIEEASEQGAAVNMEPAEISSDPAVAESADGTDGEEILSCEGGSCEIKKKTDLSRHRFADGAESMEKATINELTPAPMGGVDCDPREVIYTPGESEPKEVALPAPLAAAFHPASPEYRDARPALTNVEPPEPEPEPEPGE